MSFSFHNMPIFYILSLFSLFLVHFNSSYFQCFGRWLRVVYILFGEPPALFWHQTEKNVCVCVWAGMLLHGLRTGWKYEKKNAKGTAMRTNERKKNGKYKYICEMKEEQKCCEKRRENIKKCISHEFIFTFSTVVLLVSYCLFYGFTLISNMCCARMLRFVLCISSLLLLSACVSKWMLIYLRALNFLFVMLFSVCASLSLFHSLPVMCASVFVAWVSICRSVDSCDFCCCCCCFFFASRYRYIYFLTLYVFVFMVLFCCRISYT